MAAQGGRCAVTSIIFKLPALGELDKNTTLTSWAKTALRPVEWGRLPLLVRTRKNSVWEPGNVLLIATAIKPLYEQCDNFGGLIALMQESHTPAVPTTRQIRDYLTDNEV